MPERNLRGRRIVLVEDEYMLASELSDELADLGAIVLGPVGTLTEALSLIGEQAEVDGGIIDMNLGGEMAYEVADLLIARGVPLVLTTGYDLSALPPRFSHIARCEKPVDLTRVMKALGSVIAA